MSYIGNNPDVNAFTITLDSFSGTGACTLYTLTRSISDPNAIEVVVNGVIQRPTTSYIIISGVLAFDEAPPLGTNNITVRYLAPVVVTFNQVTASQIQPNSVTQTAIAVNSVTNEKIANNTVTGEKISTPADIFDDAFLFGGM
jgi:hypothetical protein